MGAWRTAALAVNVSAMGARAASPEIVARPRSGLEVRISSDGCPAMARIWTMSASELSIVIPVWGSDHNLRRLIPSLKGDLGASVPTPGIVVAAGPENQEIEGLAERLGATFVRASGNGFGTVLGAGLGAASGAYVVTMDGDFSHRPGFIRTMWYQRDDADVLIASRFVRGSYPEMRWARRVLIRVLNLLYRKILALPYRDLSSGFRLYRREVLSDIGPPTAAGLDALPELLVRASSQGWSVAEVPFWYQGARPFTRVRMLRLGAGYLGTMSRLFALRNSVKAADYDHRAFDSWIPLLRFEQDRPEPAQRRRDGPGHPEASVAAGAGADAPSGRHESPAVQGWIVRRGRLFGSDRARPPEPSSPLRAGSSVVSGRGPDPGYPRLRPPAMARAGVDVREGVSGRLCQGAHQQVQQP